VNAALLIRALRAKAEAINDLRDQAELRIDRGEPQSLSDADLNLLRDAQELVRVLARVVEGKPLVGSFSAFGAPGDWGYHTDIGKALAAQEQEVA